MDEQVGTFMAFTSGTAEQATRFLQLTDGNVEQAVELFFSNPDLGASAPPAAAPPAQAPAAPSSRNAPITIDDDDEDIEDFEDDDVQETGSRPAQQSGGLMEDDEAMARRLQQEMYGGAGGSGAPGGFDEEGVRAPMARTTETLVGPNSMDWRADPNDMRAAIADQINFRQNRRGPQPGIFNQREERSIWNDDDPNNAEAHRQALSRATAGASDQSAKANHLADLFRPPYELLNNMPWDTARELGKEEEKWIMVNVQDPSIFDCQVLNRDIWKNESIRDTIKEHFIFMQFQKNDARGREYIQYYMATMRDSDDAYPHIAIVDPRTGEQVKVWSGSPAPKAADFLMDLHEFLDRYSLNMERKNPVQKQRKESKKDVGQMSEEEMLEMAMQNSLANGAGPKEEDPDALTKSIENLGGKGKAPVGLDETMSVDDSAAANGSASSAPKDTPFSRISSSNPHEEPPQSSDVTRIQFKYSGGRVVRRFSLQDPVRRIYEWLKAAPFEGKEGAPFELIVMGKNLIDSLDVTIADAGLKMATVMVEFVDDD